MPFNIIAREMIITANNKCNNDTLFDFLYNEDLFDLNDFSVKVANLIPNSSIVSIDDISFIININGIKVKAETEIIFDVNDMYDVIVFRISVV